MLPVRPCGIVVAWYNYTMITRLRAWIAQALRNLTAISKEPILAVGLAIEFFNAYQQAQAGGLGIEDAAGAGVIAVLTLLGRQLVYPAVKVDAATAALKSIEPALEKPYVGGDAA